MLNLNLRTVHRMAHDGRLPPAAGRPGTRSAMVFHRADIEKMVAERRRRLEAQLAQFDRETVA